MGIRREASPGAQQVSDAAGRLTVRLVDWKHWAAANYYWLALMTLIEGGGGTSNQRRGDGDAHEVHRRINTQETTRGKCQHEADWRRGPREQLTSTRMYYILIYSFIYLLFIQFQLCRPEKLQFKKNMVLNFFQKSHLRVWYQPIWTKPTLFTSLIIITIIRWVFASWQPAFILKRCSINSYLNVLMCTYVCVSLHRDVSFTTYFTVNSKQSATFFI